MNINEKSFCFCGGSIHVGYVLDSNDYKLPLRTLKEILKDEGCEKYDVAYVFNNIVQKILTKKEAERIVKLNQL